MESNIGLLITYTVSILIMIGLPVALAFIVTARFKVSWWVILTGVLTFIVSQVIHYPVLEKISGMFNSGVIPTPAEKWLPLINALILGFLVALFEESARYFGLWIVRKKAKKTASGVALGIGHGGMQSIALAAWPFWPLYAGVLIQFINIVFYSPGAQLAKGISSDQVQYTLSQIAQFWTLPWHIGFLPGVERVIALSTQVLLSVLVWKAIRNRNFGWFALAFFYHMLVEGITVYLNYSNWNYWAIDGILAVFMLANIYLVYFFWKEESDKRKLKIALAIESGVASDSDLNEDFDEEDDDAEDEDEDDYDDKYEDEENEDEESVEPKKESSEREKD